MASFKNYYRTIYRTFGYPLTERMGTPPKVLAAAEKRLGVRIPAALRDYYLVAGRESRFNTACDWFLPPQQWRIDQRHLMFMVENQAVCWWGVSIRNPDATDPEVSRGYNEEPIEWRRDYQRCSVFLGFELHYQAVSGGFRFTGRADVPEKTSYHMKEHGWKCYGELVSMSAWSRPGQVVFIQPPGGRFTPNWSIQAGGRTKRDLQTIADEIGVDFDLG